jgi:formylglycine-generating enzyme required for sulfatase activity
MIQQLESTYKKNELCCHPTLDLESREVNNEIEKKSIFIPSGTCVMGAHFDELPFGWDNEFPQHKVRELTQNIGLSRLSHLSSNNLSIFRHHIFQVEVPAFEIDSLNVTNGEYLQFVESGGYSTPTYWRSEDWEWKEKFGLKHPIFWRRYQQDSKTYYTVRHILAAHFWLCVCVCCV